MPINHIEFCHVTDQAIYAAIRKEIPALGPWKVFDADAVQRIVDALPAPKQAEPTGYKLVPVEPTPEMINAGRICPMPTDSEWDEEEDYSAVYRAMLAAAPTPPEAK